LDTRRVSAKSPYLGTVNQVDGVVQPSLDAIEEFQVLVSGNSAENGHAAGGSVKANYKSGTNALHGSFEERYLNGKWTIGVSHANPRERSVELHRARYCGKRPCVHS